MSLHRCLKTTFPVAGLTSLRQHMRRFVRHQRGNVAIIFGIAAVPLIFAVGAAIDYSTANRAKAALDAYADAAALLAVNKASLSLSATAAQTSAVNFFKAQVAALANINSSAVTVTVTDSSLGRNAVVNYTASVPTSLMSAASINSLDIKGSSSAASALPSYIDFYLLLDNTPSMGVGATPNDVSKMVANTSDKCAFACHQMDVAPNDYYGLAKKLGVTMRIDVVRSATQQLMDTASSTQTVSNQFRMAIYTFGGAAQQAGLTQIFSLSSTLSSAKTAANNIDLMTVPYQNYASDTDTNFDSVLANVNTAISSPGDGSTSGAPQKVLFFVSDGVADAAGVSCSQPTTAGKDPQTGQAYTRCQEPLNTSFCDTIKKRGIKIAVLYTTYLALPTNSWYMTWIDPFNAGPYGPSPNSKIAQNMQSCASPGLYFEVSPTQGISDAMNALFQKAVQSARLTK
ncbi:pilus assembly protein TadG-related protein [Microbacteriaceae bacterium K1510]|nr:pilus assembly protein TadG-related protein [Microbacteriaceae bacterium K1510]